MAVLKRRTRPESWPRHRAQAKYVWLVPVFALEWSLRWLAYMLSGWAFLEVLEYFGTMSLLVAAESVDRYTSQQSGPAQHRFARRQMARDRRDKTGQRVWR